MTTSEWVPRKVLSEEVTSFKLRSEWQRDTKIGGKGISGRKNSHATALWPEPAGVFKE